MSLMIMRLSDNLGPVARTHSVFGQLPSYRLHPCETINLPLSRSELRQEWRLGIVMKTTQKGRGVLKKNPKNPVAGKRAFF